MQYAVSVLPVVPLRSLPSDKEEMISQLIFGEHVLILEKQKKWSFIENCRDNYRGWVFNSMIYQLTEEEALQLNSTGPPVLATLLLPVADTKTKYTFYIPAGSLLHHYKPASNSFHINDYHFNCLDEPLFYKKEEIREKISQTALKFLNIPYLWGGKNPFGMDCSGLTQTILSMYGIIIPRDACQQVEKGITINFISEAKPGDLAFFDNDEGEISHTGIIISNQQIIHASGQVRIDRIDHQGIYNSTIKQYTHKLRVIKNVVD